jgi:hypothetical protein
MAKRKSKVPGTDEEIEIEDSPGGEERKEAAFINEQADLMEGRVVPPPPKGAKEGEPIPIPETIFGQTNQTYDGEADPAIIIKARNKMRVYEQTGTPIGPPAQLPMLTMLEPAEAEVGGDDFELHIVGTAFTADTVILFNGGEEATTHLSDTELTTIVKPSLVSEAVVVPVAVKNASGESNPLDFEFFEYEPVTETQTSKTAKKGKKGK